MTSRNLSIPFASAVAGALIATIIMFDWIPMSTAKSDRLGGVSTETAFLPERFGVPGATPTIK